MKYPINNVWIGQIGPDYIQAWAGGISTNADSTPNSAAIWLFSITESANHCGWEENSSGEFLLSGYKSLTVTAVNGTVMTLATNTGHQINFDLVARQFK
ncbi:MAG TPA: hypothetical protein VIT43_08350 [Candidatus Dormibacteraeota bacterium]